MKSNEAMIFAVMNAFFSNCVEKPEKFRTEFEPVTSGYRCKALNQLSYEDTDVGSWSVVGSSVPVMNESMNEMNHILNCRYGIK